jgi:hypothetical protein
MARRFVLAFGWLVVGVGAWVLVTPGGLVELADMFLTAGGLWVAVALRLTIGALLWIGAAESRIPAVLRLLGALFILSGLALVVMGLDRMQAIATWGAGLDDIVLRVVGLLAAGLGAFIIWSAWPRGSES